MTLEAHILELIKQRPGITDAGLAALLPGNVSRHQQINRRCRALAARGVITREKRGRKHIGNYPNGQSGKMVAPEPIPAFEPEQLRISLIWHNAGDLRLDDTSRPVFPRLNCAPGLYRLRQPRKRHFYVGESVNLRRRMQNYRTPGPTQKTSLWVHDWLVRVLRRNDTILIDCCIDVTINMTQGRAPGDLGSKTVRLLAENTALLLDGAKGWIALNKEN